MIEDFFSVLRSIIFNQIFYATGRWALPLLTFGKIYAAASDDQRGFSFFKILKRDGNGQLRLEWVWVMFAGTLVWCAILIAILCIAR